MNTTARANALRRLTMSGSCPPHHFTSSVSANQQTENDR